MNFDDKFLIFYPYANHPLCKEKLTLRIKYICLIEHYRDKFAVNDLSAFGRVHQLKSLLLQEAETNEIDIKEAQRAIMKSRFTPFRIFSYRYIFLFDCIFLLAPTDENLAKQICEEMKSSVHRCYHKRMDMIVQRMFMFPTVYPGKPIPEELFHAWSDIQDFRTKQEKHIILTATMSAGKSTLVNSLIGQELSFSKKAACTATTMEFISTPVYHPWYHVLFAQEFKPNLPPEEIRAFTRGRDKPCTIAGFFQSVLGRQRVKLIDTPGVDSSQNPLHKTITRDALKSGQNDILIYVIPVENYGSEDDYAHLKFVREKVQYKKILFVINMMDTCDFEDDSVDEILKNVVEHLKSIGFERPVVCPISAKAGFLFKLALAGGELSKNDEQELMALYSKFQQPEYNLEPCYGTSKAGNIAGKGYNLSAIEESDLISAYLRTGLPAFETKLLQMIAEE